MIDVRCLVALFLSVGAAYACPPRTQLPVPAIGAVPPNPTIAVPFGAAIVDDDGDRLVVRTLGGVPSQTEYLRLVSVAATSGTFEVHSGRRQVARYSIDPDYKPAWRVWTAYEDRKHVDSNAVFFEVAYCGKPDVAIFVNYDRDSRAVDRDERRRTATFADGSRHVVLERRCSDAKNLASDATPMGAIGALALLLLAAGVARRQLPG